MMTIDKPWLNEPNRVEFEHAGLPCLLQRAMHVGTWCGYVAVPPGHPLHGADYETPDVSVHGGLTYAKACHGSICHVPKPGEPDDVWWFGFDCAHCGDFMPALERARAFDARGRSRRAYAAFGGVYRDIAYVTAETKRLAEQLGSACARRLQNAYSRRAR